MTKEIASETLSETLAETALAIGRRIAPQDTPAGPARKGGGLPRLADLAVAGLLSVSLVAGSAQPSMANHRNNDFAKALGAALVLGLIISAIDGKAKADPKPEPKKPAPKKPEPKKPHDPKPRPRHEPEPRPRHEAIPTVPANCALDMQGRGGPVYSENCLRREGFDYRLPNCGREVRIYGRIDRVYSEPCLDEAGFRTRSRRY